MLNLKKLASAISNLDQEKMQRLEIQILLEKEFILIFNFTLCIYIKAPYAQLLEAGKEAILELNRSNFVHFFVSLNDEKSSLCLEKKQENLLDKTYKNNNSPIK